MPGFDGTGPNGNGPLTGRGMGRCEGAASSQRPRRGMGQGVGRGRGRCRWTTPLDIPAEDQKTILERELETLKQEQEAIEKKLNEMK